MTKSILIATPLYPPDIGGPATYVKILEEELSKKGFKIQILSFGEVRHLPKIIRHLVYFFKLLTLAREYDLIFALDPVSVGLPAHLTAKLFKKPFYLKVVGDYAWEQWQQKVLISNFQFSKFITPEEFQKQRFDFLTELRRRLQKHVAKSAKMIIVPSRYLAGIIRLWGILDEKIKVIYNAFEPPTIFESKEDLRKKFGWDKKIIISAGRDVPWKGFGLLRKVVKAIPEADLFIANNLSREELLRRIKAADLFVLNSGYEGFSHQLLEVMALGTPIITTEVGGNPELIEDQIHGRLVPYNDIGAIKQAIIDAWQKPEDTKKMAERSKERVREFSKDRMIKELMVIFV